MNERSFTIELVADHPEWVDTIAGWHWDEWGAQHPGQSAEQWEAGFRQRINRDRIPLSFVALDDETPMGSITLVEHDLETHRELSPWIAGVFVHPDFRRRGIARALVEHACQAAAKLGIRRLYLYTESPSARRLYLSLGWQPIGEEVYRGDPITIMTKEISPRSSEAGS